MASSRKIALRILCLALLFCPNAARSATARAAVSRQNAGGFARQRAAHPPRTIWERMGAPRGWQRGLSRAHTVAADARIQSGTGALPHPFDSGAIANPIFFVPPTFNTGGAQARNVAIGDFSGDGKNDLLVTNQCLSSTDCTQGSVAVLLGNGDGTYQPALVSATGAILSSVAVGDFNRDGKLDVAVDNACTDVACTNGSVHVLLGNGNGTFQSPVAYATGSSAFSVQTGDVNSDGKLDLVVVNSPTTAEIFLGNGDGTFQTPLTVTTSGVGNSAVFLGDFNGDHKLDLGVATSNCGAVDCDASVSVLLGNGDGSFQSATGTQTFTSHNVQAVALGDANHDGKLDFAVVLNCVPDASTCPSEIVDVLPGNGDGTFGAVKTSALPTMDITSIEFGDLNGDGKPDLATVDAGSAGISSVLLGKGDGTFTLQGSYETGGEEPLFGAFGDLNGDGKIDFAVADECQPNAANDCMGMVIVLSGDGRGGFAGPVGFTTGGVSPVIAAGDLNGDGLVDVAVASLCISQLDCVDSGVSLLLGKSGGGFRSSTSYDPGGYSPDSVAVGDFNGDGKLDVIVINDCVTLADCSHGVIGVLLGNGDGTLGATAKYSTGGMSPKSVAVGDFNGDGKLDIALVQCVGDSDSCFDGSNGSVSIFLGNGDGSFASPVNYSSGAPYSESVTIADFNRDGKADLAVANGNCTAPGPALSCQTGSVGVLLGNGDGTFQTAVPYSAQDPHSFSLAVADFNGDGKLDIALANFNCTDPQSCAADASISILAGNGDGTFQDATTYPGGGGFPMFSARPNSLAASDLNGDGKPDLVLASRAVLLGNGDGSFQAAQNYNPAGVLGYSNLVADFNGDGKPDLLVAGNMFVVELPNISTGFLNATSTALKSSVNPANFHRRVTLTATISTASQNAPSGTITFSDSGHALASIPVSHGKARFSTFSLDPGTHAITATYGGDQNFLPSTSPELDEVIRAETRIKLTSSTNPSQAGQSVTFTVVVNANSGGTPAGSITFRDFSIDLGTVPLNAGTASFTTSFHHKGLHLIWAQYNGDAVDQRSFNVLAQRVR